MDLVSRIASMALSELREIRGEVITALAVAAVVAVVVDETAALVLGIAAILIATLAALALSSRSRDSDTSQRAQSVNSPETTQEDPRVPIGRAQLLEVASRLDLANPPEKRRRSAADFQPLVSVIVPCFNDGGYVAEAIESVMQQSYAGWECIVVDDGSTDGSWNVVRETIGDDDRFQAVRLDENQGSGAARNHGIGAAVGDYIAFLDADDLLLSASLEDRVQAVGERRNDPFVVGSFCAVRSESSDVTLASLPDRRHATQAPFIDFVSASGECPFTLHAPLLSSNVVKQMGGFDESMTTGAVDWDLWYRILRSGYVFVPSRTLGAIYRQKEGGITRSNKAGHTEASSRLIRAAFAPASEGTIIAPTEFPMTRSLGEYQATLVVADRAVRFAAMALAEGDVGDMHKTLGVLERGTWPLLDRHIDWRATVGRGVVRVVGLRPKHIPDLEDAIAPYVSAVRSAVEEVTR